MSAHSKAPAQALDLLRWLTSVQCQSTFFGICLGQPADRHAWSLPLINATTSDFFKTGLPLLDAAWLRPPEASFHAAQSRLADVLHACLAGVAPVTETRQEIVRLLAPCSV